MGGYSSGRYRTRNRGAVEDTIRLDIRRLRRQGWLRLGATSTGTLRWHRGDQEVGSIGIRVSMADLETAHAQLNYSSNGEPRSERIIIAHVPCRYGGHRFYFRCPRTMRLCEVLPCIGGQFASRQFHRLAYASQSESPLDRLHRARLKAEARMNGDGSYPKPRGDRRRRLVAKWIALEQATDELFTAHFERRFGRFAHLL